MRDRGLDFGHLDTHRPLKTVKTQFITSTKVVSATQFDLPNPCHWSLVRKCGPFLVNHGDTYIWYIKPRTVIVYHGRWTRETKIFFSVQGLEPSIFAKWQGCVTTEPLVIVKLMGSLNYRASIKKACRKWYTKTTHYNLAWERKPKFKNKKIKRMCGIVVGT